MKPAARMLISLCSLTLVACSASAPAKKDSGLEVRSLASGPFLERMVGFTESILALVAQSSSKDDLIHKVSTFCVAEADNLTRLRAEASALADDAIDTFTTAYLQRTDTLLARAQPALSGKEALLEDEDVLTATEQCSPVPDNWLVPEDAEPEDASPSESTNQPNTGE